MRTVCPLSVLVKRDRGRTERSATVGTSVVNDVEDGEDGEDEGSSMRMGWVAVYGQWHLNSDDDDGEEVGGGEGVRR